MSKVDIVVPTFNNSEHTNNLIDSLADYTDDFRVIWVDNCSDLDHYTAVKEHIVKVNHLNFLLPTNLGFVKAVNLGIAASTAPYVVIQNNDTLVEKDWIDKMIAVFDKQPKAGLVGPSTVIAESWQNRDNLKKHWPEPFPEIIPISGMLAFFSVVIKREVIQTVGYLSEEYGMGFGDDDDYCERVKQAGYDLYLRADVTVPHLHRTTFNKYIKDWEVDKQKNLEHFKKKWNKI